jgi:hypothetical protein
MNYQNTAQGLASLGRGKDTMLMHVTPNEVAGLQQLAMAQGGSLTINPQTGLPEASFFDDVFSVAAPIALGAALGPAGFGVMGSLGAGVTVGALTYALTGDPIKAVTSGFGASGGATLGGKLGAYGATPEIAKVAGPSFGQQTGAAAGSIAKDAAGNVMASTTPGAATVANLTAAPAATTYAPLAGSPMGMANSFNMATGTPLNAVANVADDALAAGAGQYSQNMIPNVGQGIKNFFGMGEAGKGPIDFFKTGPGDMGDALTLGAPVLAGYMGSQQVGLPALANTSSGMNYDGPYEPNERQVSYPTAGERRSSREFKYFSPSNPIPGYQKAYAMGGPVSFEEGGKIPTIGEIPKLGVEIKNQIPDMGSRAIVDTERQAEIDAREARIAELMKPTRGGSGYDPYANMMNRGPTIGQTSGSWLTNMDRGPMYGGLSGTGGGYGMSGKGMGRPGLTRAQAEARVPLSEFIPINERAEFLRQYLPEQSIEAAADPTGAERLQFTNVGAPEVTDQTAVKVAAGGYLDFTEGGRTGIVSQQQLMDNPVGYAMGGGIHSLRSGGKPAKGGYLDGAGDGMSDSIPATIEGKQPARLADGEFVIPADVVSHLGNGSTKAGAKRLYAMLDKVRTARTGTKKQGKKINADKYLTA